MGITKRSILFRFKRTSSHHIATETTCRTKASWVSWTYTRSSFAAVAAGSSKTRGSSRPEMPRSRIQGDRGASAQRRRTEEGSATRPEAWERKSTAEAVLRRLRRRAPPAEGRVRGAGLPEEKKMAPHFV